MGNTALILGAGSGSRMRIEQSKLLLKIGGKTVLEHSVSAFYHKFSITQLIVVCRACDQKKFEDVLRLYPDVTYVIGGATRQQSVMNALSAVPNDTQLLLIHDGARPCVSEAVIASTLHAANVHRAAATGVPVKDTIKVIDDTGMIVDTPNRDLLFSIQTPQIFDYALYQEAIKLAINERTDFTDDCQLIERMGVRVQTVIGSYNNLKITTKEDLPYAISILKERGATE